MVWKNLILAKGNVRFSGSLRQELGLAFKVNVPAYGRKYKEEYMLTLILDVASSGRIDRAMRRQ